MHSEETDEQIIILFKTGNEEVFKILIDRYTPILYNFVARLTDKDNASDILQETFIKVWKNLKKFDEEKASFKTWIFTIAKNTTTDFLRKKKSLIFSDFGKDEEENSFENNIPDEDLLPDEILQRTQDFELLNKTLEKLTINYRTILILHYQEDMTFKEIGEILDKPLNTIKNQHYRAIFELRKMLT